MTEAEWLECADPDRLLGFLDRRSAPPRGGLLGLLLPRRAGTGEGLSRRKLTLFACACCRRIGHLLTDLGGRGTVRFADDLGVLRRQRQEVESLTCTPRLPPLTRA